MNSKKICLFYIALALAGIGLGLGLNSCSLSSTANNSVSNFTLVYSWTGSAGEVISSVFVDGTNIYAAAGANGLYVFNSSLGYLNSFATNNPVKDVVIKTVSAKKYAVTANGIYNGKGGVMTINVNDFANLQLTNYGEFSGFNPNALAADDADTNVFTADQYLGFQTYTNWWLTAASLTNKTINLSASGWDIDVSGKMAYVACKTSGVSIINMNQNYVAASISSTLYSANAVAVSGGGDGTLLAVGDSLGLILYSMASPDSPSSPRYLGGYYGTPVYDVVIDGNDFYLALGTAGALKLTRTPPATFTAVKEYKDVPCYKLFYYSTTGYIYAACGKDGIRVLR